LTKSGITCTDGERSNKDWSFLILKLDDFTLGFQTNCADMGGSRPSERWNCIWYRARQSRRNGRGRCNANKQNVAGLWNNFDFEFSQKVIAQNGTCHSGLQKTRSENFALKLDSSLDESPRWDRLSICSFTKRPDGLEFEVQGIMLKVAPVSTKNLS
jgi:hypothetical protein